VSPTTTPTFVGFPSINFISKCIKDFQDINMTTIGGTMYLFSLSSPIYPLPLVCLTKTLLCGSLRNDIFTIYQIGFIGTIIQW
jgi:hypothetical protein